MPELKNLNEELRQALDLDSAADLVLELQNGLVLCEDDERCPPR